MAVFKCKMCGANLLLNGNSMIAKCEYCETLQTVPRISDERIERLYDRASHFRRNNDYDKAMAIYEEILEENNEDAESYWSIILCNYGIEYVEDPYTHKRIPTVNRTQYTSIFDDEDYKAALRYADASQKDIYEKEANAINEIQKKILDISQKEEPFDVFICYKETDERGVRTYDSVYANDLYHELTEEGFKVFFSRITLENRLGSAYEPYIFSALNSAKVMVVIGTKPEHFNAVWVKNEWSRYLALIKNGAKKTLIPAYRDMNAYDLPKEFSHLQAQDMSKLGFMPDLIRGIKKITGRYDDFYIRGGIDDYNSFAHQKTELSQKNSEVDPLLKRVALFVQHAEWESADVYCERVLDIDPENAQAYIYKLLVMLRITDEENLKFSLKPIEQLLPYKNALRFADEKTVERLLNYNDIIRENIKKQRYEEEMQKIAMDQQQKVQEARNELVKARTIIDEEHNVLVAKKTNIELSMETNRKSVDDCKKKKKVLRVWGLITLVSTILPFVFVDLGEVLFWSSFILMLVCSGFLCKANGRSRGLVLLSFFTIGIFSMIYSIVSMHKSKKIVKVDIKELNNDFDRLSFELQQTNIELDKNAQKLKDNVTKAANLK